MKRILLYIILFMALGLAGTVAYVSVTGLLKVFAGAGLAGLIFFISIEVGKIVATSAIHTYGKIIGWVYKSILSLFILIAMAITSLGIYGFLSSSYKESFVKMENIDSRIELLEKKRDGYQSQLDVVNQEKESITLTITELSKGLSNNVIQYKDSEGNIITTTSSSTRKTLEKQLERATNRQSELNVKSDELSNKVFELDSEITDVKLSDGTSNELGPLKYLADVTGRSMDDVMKYFILLLIIIGDPMAILMVIIFNKIVNNDKDDKIKKENNISKLFNRVKNIRLPKLSNETKIDPNPNEINHPVKFNEETDETELNSDILPLKEDVILDEIDEIKAEVNDESESNVIIGNNEEVIEVKSEVTPIETPELKTEELKKEEVKVKGVQLDDIKEIKEKKTVERGFSVKIPNRRDNNKIGNITYFNKK